jgi:hypothetical protein
LSGFHKASTVHWPSPFGRRKILFATQTRGQRAKPLARVLGRFQPAISLRRARFRRNQDGDASVRFDGAESRFIFVIISEVHRQGIRPGMPAQDEIHCLTFVSHVGDDLEKSVAA